MCVIFKTKQYTAKQTSTRVLIETRVLTMQNQQKLADKMTGISRRKKVGKKWVNINKTELVEALETFQANKCVQPLTADSASGMSQTYEEMPKLAKTRGMRRQKKVGGKWVNMRKEELQEDFKAFEAVLAEINNNK